MTATIIMTINGMSPHLTLLSSVADAQGCANVSCDVFYKRHAAQVPLLIKRNPNLVPPFNRNYFTLVYSTFNTTFNP
jgi:hypothetical protein